MRLLPIILSVSLFTGCATSPQPAQQEAAAAIGIASAIERTSDPAKTAALIIEIATMPMSVDGVANTVKARVRYDKLQPSTQLAIDAVLDELDLQFAADLTAADKDATLDLWRRAAISAARRFAP